MNQPRARCNLIVIRSPDLEQAEAFYGALGLEFIRHAHGKGPEHLACEQERLAFEIYPLAGGAQPTTPTRVGFSVPSVDEVFEALLAAGGTSVSTPSDSPWGRRAVVADPDGHCIELTS